MPFYGVERELPLAFRGVYRLDLDSGALTLQADDFAQPNGLCFSVDEQRLFVNDTGMKIDRQSQLYCCGPGGIHVFDTKARCLGVLPTPQAAANFNWGDDDLKSL